jgi:hypothetical protein
MKTIFFETATGEQYKVSVIDREIDAILDQLNQVSGTRYLKKEEFDQEDLMTIDITMEPNHEKIGEISCKKKPAYR